MSIGEMAHEVGAFTWDGPAPDHLARLEYLYMRSLGVPLSERGAAKRWGITSYAARKIIKDAEQNIRVVLADKPKR